jgi:hypothetical protein
MMMSVFRQGGRYQKLDHLVCLERSTTDHTTRMILHARLHNTPTLVGLQDGQAIIKPLEDGDESLSFEGLFDTCLSLREWQRMQAAGVKDLAQVPDALFIARISMEIAFIPEVHVKFKARDDIAAKAVLGRLLSENNEFINELAEAISRQLIEADYAKISSLGGKRIAETTTEDTPDWEILKPEE